MIEPISQPGDNELLNVEHAARMAVERRGVQNEGGFLTPYYLFDLMERKHADELDPIGRDIHRKTLKRAFLLAQKSSPKKGPEKNIQHFFGFSFNELLCL